MKTLFLLQEERVLVYKEFSSYFKEYLIDINIKKENSATVSENLNFIQFRFICKQISEKFNKISLQILEIKKNLSDNRKNLINLIQKLQDYEENKFKLVSIHSTTYYYISILLHILFVFLDTMETFYIKLVFFLFLLLRRYNFI
jgi:hypothetical protein